MNERPEQQILKNFLNTLTNIRWVDRIFFEECSTFVQSYVEKIPETYSSNILQSFFTAMEQHITNVITQHTVISVQYLQTMTAFQFTITSLKALLKSMPEKETSMYMAVFEHVKHPHAIASFLLSLHQTRDKLKSVNPNASETEIDQRLIELMEMVSRFEQRMDTSNLGYLIVWVYMDQLVPCIHGSDFDALEPVFFTLQENYSAIPMSIKNMGSQVSIEVLMDSLLSIPSPKKEDIKQLLSQDKRWGKIYVNLSESTLLSLLSAFYAVKNARVVQEKDYGAYLELFWAKYTLHILEKEGDVVGFNDALSNLLKQSLKASVRNQNSFFEKQQRNNEEQTMNVIHKDFEMPREKLDDRIFSENLFPILLSTTGFQVHPLISKQAEALIRIFNNIGDCLMGFYEKFHGPVETIRCRKVHYPPEEAFELEKLPGFEEHVEVPTFHFIGGQRVMVQFPKPIFNENKEEERRWEYPYFDAGNLTLLGEEAILNDFRCDLIGGLLTLALKQADLSFLPGVEALRFSLQYRATVGGCEIDYQGGGKEEVYFGLEGFFEEDHMQSLEDVFGGLLDSIDHKVKRCPQFENSVKNSEVYKLLSKCLDSMNKNKISDKTTTYSSR